MVFGEAVAEAFDQGCLGFVVDQVFVDAEVVEFEVVFVVSYNFP